MITNVFILAVPVVRIFDLGAEAQRASEKNEESDITEFFVMHVRPEPAKNSL